MKRAATPCVSRCWERVWMPRLPISCSPTSRRWRWRPASQVYDELHAQAEAAQRLRAQQVERARYAAELAQRRFLRVTS